MVPPRISFLMTAGPTVGSELTSSKGSAFSLTVGRTRVSKLYIRDMAVSEKHAVVSCHATTGLPLVP